jgi:hypothetical protein
VNLKMGDKLGKVADITGENNVIGLLVQSVSS